jgi:hypothetical protein
MANFGCSRVLLCWCVLLCAPVSVAAASERGGEAHLTRQQLIGAWRLVRIEYSGASGPIVDPFYQADSVGIIVYDVAGWMSCQIAAPHRRSSQVPESRLASSDTPQQLRLKAAAFDTYYAYYGTWDFDSATSVVSHHVESSLIPAESGMTYAQIVTLEGGHLIFRTRATSHGKQALRTKVWERLARIADPD